MDIAKALETLGWRTNTAARLAQAVGDFQQGWNLGPTLVVDRSPGPATRAALALSMERRRKGLPDFSANFSAREFRCRCGGAWSDCRRIWVTRETVRVAEQVRALVGPYTPVRGCRCPGENARVGGAKNSQHLHGRALDLPLYSNLTVTAVRALRSVTGIGFYYVGGRQLVRHVDTRTGATAAAPALWDYGTYNERTHGAIRDPQTAPPPPPPGGLTMSDINAILARLDALPQRIWWDSTVYRGEERIPVIQELADAKTIGLQLEAKVAAQEAAIAALGSNEGVDPDALAKIIDDAVSRHVSALQVDVRIGGTATPPDDTEGA